MLLENESRESGIEFSVGCFLLALGCGLLIPRPGLGLYSIIKEGGYAHLWSLALVSSALFLIFSSSYRRPKMRITACLLGAACWTALAFKFIDGALWGATLQASVAIFLLNACVFRLYRYTRLGASNGN